MNLFAAAVASLWMAAACLLTPASAATPDEIIAMRQANQKRVGELFDAMKKSVAAGATATSQVDAVKEIDERAHLIKGYFPAGTETGGNTKARPEIWTNRDGFNQAADNYVAAFDKLLVLANAGDTAAFNAAYAEAGATCGACHRNFRAR